MSESSETTAAKGEIVDPAKIKEAAAAASNGSEEAKKESSSPNGKVGAANGDGASAANGNGKAAEEPPVAGSSKSPSKKDVDLVTRAMGYLAAGKRDLLIRDPASAVASLAQACQLLGEHYGETAPECGEPYYYYGRALLDLARMEAGVIDNVLDGVPSEDDSADDSMVGDPEKCTDEEKEKVEKDVDEALQENYESLEKMKSEKEAKEKAENGKDIKEADKATNGDAADGKIEDKTDGNCATKNGKSSPAAKEKDAKVASPADKAKNGKAASPADKNGKAASPADKNGKASSPAAKDKEEAVTSPRHQGGKESKDSKSSPAAKDSKSSPVSKESKSSPVTKETKASPVSKESKSSPATKESKASPATKETKASPSSKESKSSPKDAKAEDKPKYEAVTPEGAAKEEKMEVDDGKAKEEKAEASKNGDSKTKKESEEDSKDGDEEEEEEGEEGEANGEDKENDEKEDEEMEEGEKDDKDDSIQGDEAEKGDVAAAEKEDEEDPSNLQLAWEMLELAKNILVKQSETVKEEEKDRKTAIDSRICDTFQTLGELSIENENYPQAIEDLGTCLSRRQKMLPEDSRLIAETHYQLGVARGFNVEFDQAVGSLNSAISVLQKRIDNLKAKTESVDPSKKADAFYTREAEIKEIESLIPEIKEKITDTNDMKAETHKKLVEARLAGEEEIASKSDTSKVSTISTSLIKKRKKSESGDADEAKNGDQPSDKKPHIEEETKSTKEGETSSST